MKFFVTLLTLSAIGQLKAEHQNNAFLPGDAFFSTSLTVEEISKIEKSQTSSISLFYKRLDNRSIPGGHLGYFDLKLTGVDSVFRSNFLAAFEEVRGWDEPTFVKREVGGKPELWEWNPVVALIYNNGKVKFPLGIKFNEDWMTQGEGEYCGFLDDGWSIFQDWKRGPKVPPLKLSKDLDPKLHHTKGRGVVPKGMKEILLLEASEAEIVFVGLLEQQEHGAAECPNLKTLAKFANWRDESAKPAYSSYVRVTSEKVTKVAYEYGKRIETILNEQGEWEAVEDKQ